LASGLRGRAWGCRRVVAEMFALGGVVRTASGWVSMAERVVCRLGRLVGVRRELEGWSAGRRPFESVLIKAGFWVIRGFDPAFCVS